MQTGDNTLVAVSGYSGDKHQIEANLPVYLHHGCPVIIFSPSDAPITSVSNRSVHCWWIGQKGWIGKHTLERQRLYLERLLTFSQDWFLFHDSDSICVSPQLPKYLYDEPNILHANVVPDTNPGPSYLPKVALQPPYFFHRSVIKQLLSGAAKPADSFYGPPVSPDGWPMPFPTECIDHWMLQIAHSGHLAYRNFFDGASFETGTPGGAATMVDLVRHHGRNFLHSIKTAPVLAAVQAAYKERAAA